MNFGSTPHLGQQQQQQQHQSYQGNNYGAYTMRSAPTNRDYPQNQFVDDQGRYVQHQQPSQQQMAPVVHHSPYQVGRTNSYNPMVNNGNNGGGYTDSYGMGDTGYQSSGPLPIQLHKNFLSRENLNQAAQQSYFNNSSGGGGSSEQQFSGGGVPQPQSTNQFYLHDQNGSPPVAPQRRTWAQSAAMQQQQQKSETSWSSPQSASPKPSNGRGGGGGGGGFMLHQNGNNAAESFLNDSGSLFPVHTSSPQHSRVHRQISQIMDKSVGGGGEQQHTAAASRVSWFAVNRHAGEWRVMRMTH